MMLYFFISFSCFLTTRLLPAVLAAMVACWPTLTFALPTGANVVSGNVSFNQNGNTLDITSTTEHAIVEYTTFDVGLGQTVNFNLPSATASILNRVVGALGIVLPSTIAGTINSNQGSVMLVNTSGVNFTGAATMNVASFIASTLDISNADYLNDYLAFDRGALLPAAVTMGGDINAVAGSYIGLFGAHVEVDGAINASGSQVSLAVGDEITVDLANGFAATVTVDAPLLTLVGGLVDAIHLNGGTITADNLEIVAEIESLLYQRTINLDGLIDVTPVDVAQQDIDLTAHGSGSITQSGGTVTGDSVTLQATGGSVGGVDAAIQTQAATLTVSADTIAGTGVVTDVDGVTLAGVNAGHTLVVNAGNDLGVSGTVAATDLTLGTTGNNGTVTVDTNVSATNDLVLSAHGSGDIIQTNGVLGGNTSITLASGTGTIGTGANAIGINTDALTVTTGGTANLVEADGITVHGSTLGTDFTLNAGNTITTDGVLTGGDIDLVTTAGNGGVSLGANLTATGDVTLQTHGSGNITQTVGSVTGNDLIATSTGGNITLETTVATAAINTAGDVTVDETNAITLNTSSAGDAFTVTAGGDVTVANGHSVTLADGDLTVTSNDIKLLGTANTGANGTVTLAPVNNNAVVVGAAADDVLTTIFDVDTTELGNITTGHLTIGDATGNGSLTVTGNWAANQGLTLQTGSSLDTSAATIAVGNNNLTLTAGSDLITGTITGGTATLTTTSTNVENTGTIHYTQGTLAITTDTTDLGGGTITTGPAGSATIAPNTPTTTIGLGDPSDGYTHGGGELPVPPVVGEVPGTLNLTQAEVDTINTGSLAIGNTVTAGNVYIGALDLTGTTTDLVVRTTGSMVDITPTVDITPNIATGPGANVTITGGNGTGAGQVGSAGGGDIDIVTTGGGTTTVTVAGGGSSFINQPVAPSGSGGNTDSNPTGGTDNGTTENYAYLLSSPKKGNKDYDAENGKSNSSVLTPGAAIGSEELLSSEADEISLCNCEFRRDEEKGTLQAVVKNTKALVAIYKTGHVVSEIVASGNCQKIYVADYDNNVVYRINPTTKKIAAVIPVGQGPVSMYYHTATQQLLVANQKDKTITSIATQMDAVVKTQPLAFIPSKFKVAPWQEWVGLQGYLPSGKPVEMAVL